MSETPERALVVVTNTTPIISLGLIGHLELLRQLYTQVIIAPAVRAELEQGGANRIGVLEVAAASWIQTIPLQDSRRADLLGDLDRGEAETIALAQELNCDLVLIDERLGRRFARRAGLNLSGTLGVLIKAKERGLVPQIKPLITQLVQGGIRLDEFVITEALELAREK